MQKQTEEERELAQLIVESLDLEDVSPEDIEPDDSLFSGSLGLDSIDALELALSITQKYSIQMKADDDNMQQVFDTLRTLSAFVQKKLA